MSCPALVRQEQVLAQSPQMGLPRKNAMTISETQEARKEAKGWGPSEKVGGRRRSPGTRPT